MNTNFLKTPKQEEVSPVLANVNFAIPNSCHYSNSLKFFKSTLLGGSEKDILANSIREYFSGEDTSVIEMLDIGVGDGEFLKKIIQLLENSNINISITGLDPSSKDLARFRKRFPGAEIHSGRFETYKTNREFHLLNATQSLYYMTDVESNLKKMADTTKTGGLIMITLWSEKCILYEIHRRFWNCNTRTAEYVAKLIKSIDNLELLDIENFEGWVDFERWTKDYAILEGALTILSRDFTRSRPDPEFVRKFERFLITEKFDNIGLRRNGVIVARKI